jgi:hypothetical protein
MKKYLLALLALAVLFVSGQSLNAQTKPIGASLNWGLVTDESFKFKPFLWTAGFMLDFFATPSLSISPEAVLIITGVDFEKAYFAPAVLASFHTDAFYAGAGITKWFQLGSGVDWDLKADVKLKIQAGVKVGNLKFGLWVVTPFSEMFSHVAVVLAWGFYF